MENKLNYNLIRISEKRKRIGVYLREQRLSRDLTIEQLASKASLAAQTIGAIERGRPSSPISRARLREALAAIPVPPGVSMLWQDESPATATDGGGTGPIVDIEEGVR